MPRWWFSKALCNYDSPIFRILFATFFRSNITQYFSVWSHSVRVEVRCEKKIITFMLTSHLKRSRRKWWANEESEKKHPQHRSICIMTEWNTNKPKRSFWDSCATIGVRHGHKSLIWTSYSSITQVICCQSTITYPHIRCKHRAIQFLHEFFLSLYIRRRAKKKSSRWMHDVLFACFSFYAICKCEHKKI